MGVTSASLIVVIVVAAAVGAIVGGILGDYAPPVAIALAAGIVATVVAVIVRNKLVHRLSGAGPDEGRIPVVVAVFGIIGSIAGSLAGKEVSTRPVAPILLWVGDCGGPSVSGAGGPPYDYLPHEPRTAAPVIPKAKRVFVLPPLHIRVGLNF